VAYSPRLDEYGGLSGNISPDDTRLKEMSLHPTSARVWNFWLGGKDYFRADRELAELIQKEMPDIPLTALAGRTFLNRCVRSLAQSGVTQFLDLGSGFPGALNTHEIAQTVAPSARTVYVDWDMQVIAHARALLTSAPEGVCDWIPADFADHDKVLRASERSIDFSRPVAALFVTSLDFAEAKSARSVLDGYLGALAPGSYLVIAHTTGDTTPAAVAAAGVWNRDVPQQPITLRSRKTVSELFDGLTLEEPGIVPANAWWPDNAKDAQQQVSLYAGVGRKT
jgi:hypothetical protein